MSDRYRIFGAEPSPYSVKVRSYFRYKELPHEWLSRGGDNEVEYRRHAKLPLIPVVVAPEGEALQDSTPILETIEARHPDPSIHPPDPALAFLSALIEEFGDEWSNKWMFHYRWARAADQDSAAERIARSMLPPGASAQQLSGAIQAVKGRMIGRVGLVGSNPQTAPQIERSYQEALALLEAHLARRPYLFGGCPAFGDFGLWGQLYECFTDPTPGALLRERAPAVTRWVERMQEPRAEGGFEEWSGLEPTLLPFFAQQVGALFLPWSDANARALAAGLEELRVDLPTGTWTQVPQKYHAKSLAVLRARWASSAQRDALDPILESADCLRWLSAR